MHRTTVNKPESSEMVLVPRELLGEIEQEFVLLKDLPAFIRRMQDEIRAARAAAHPSNQVQEPVAWMWQHDETGHTGFVEHCSPEERAYWERVNKPRKFVTALYASPQAVPSEQPIAEQPKSNKANLMVAVGSDLPPALSLDPARAMACRNSNRSDCALFGTSDDKTPAWVRLSDEIEASPPRGSAREARVEPVVGPLSSARSDLPSMPPPAASLPVSAPAGVRMLSEDESILTRKEQSGRYGTKGSRPYADTLAFSEAVQRKFCEVNGLKLAAMSATTKEQP